MIQKALKFSEIRHKGQMYGDSPYMNHIHDVVELAKKLGYNEDIQVCCALHDVLEDTDTNVNDIISNFGVGVFETVWAVTDANGKDRKEKKRNTYPKIKGSYKATIVKVLDRVCNINACLENENHDKFKMYQDEHKELFESVKSENHSNLVIPAWEEYAKFFGLNLDISYKNYIKSLSNS